MASEREWPRGQSDGSEKRGPTAYFVTPDGYFKSNRSVSGDMGTDRVRRDFDPMGTARNRFGAIDSELFDRKVGVRRS